MAELVCFLNIFRIVPFFSLFGLFRLILIRFPHSSFVSTLPRSLFGNFGKAGGEGGNGGGGNFVPKEYLSLGSSRIISGYAGGEGGNGGRGNFVPKEYLSLGSSRTMSGYSVVVLTASVVIS